MKIYENKLKSMEIRRNLFGHGKGGKGCTGGGGGLGVGYRGKCFRSKK